MVIGISWFWFGQMNFFPIRRCDGLDFAFAFDSAFAIRFSAILDFFSVALAARLVAATSFLASALAVRLADAAWRLATAVVLALDALAFVFNGFVALRFAMIGC